MNTWLDITSAENDVEVTPEHKPGMNQYCQGNVNRNVVSERGKVTCLFWQAMVRLWLVLYALRMETVRRGAKMIIGDHHYLLRETEEKNIIYLKINNELI